MSARNQPVDSLLSLSLDVASAKVLVWIASVGRDAELTSDAHIYFFDRYSRLAHTIGRVVTWRKPGDFRSRVTSTLGPEVGDHRPPYAAAMATARPSRFVTIDTIGRRRVDGPDDAA